MTTAYFPGSAPTSAAKPAAPAAKSAAKAPQAAVSAAFAAYPWLTAQIRRNMSARAVRLMRADY
jgi:hypothetical protein